MDSAVPLRRRLLLEATEWAKATYIKFDYIVCSSYHVVSNELCTCVYRKCILIQRSGFLISPVPRAHPFC